MKGLIITLALLLVLVSGCIPVEKSLEQKNEITGQVTEDGWIGEGDPPMGRPKGDIVTPISPTIIRTSLFPDSYGQFNCADFDGDFNAASCANSCSEFSNAYQVFIAGSDGLKKNFDDCALEGMVCCMQSDLYDNAPSEYCQVLPGTKEGDCNMIPYWNKVSNWIEDMDRCAANADFINDEYACQTCQDSNFWFAKCLNTDFFCNRYMNAFCAESDCNRQSLLTCKQDSDCWPSLSSTEDEKKAICQVGSCLAFNAFGSDCVARKDNKICSGLTFDGNQQSGYNGAITLRGTNNRYGCEKFDKENLTYDCCIETGVNETDEWEKSLYYNKMCSPGITLEPAAINPYFLGLTNIHVSDGMYKKQSLTCYWGDVLPDEEDCVSGECCNGIDDDGDGAIDGLDSMCMKGFDTEGGVCFARCSI